MYTQRSHTLYSHNHDAGADPYCIVKVGRQKAVTPIQKNTLDPNFNCKVMFFIGNPGSAEVSVEVSTCTCMNSWSTRCLHCPGAAMTHVCLHVIHVFASAQHAPVPTLPFTVCLFPIPFVHLCQSTYTCSQVWNHNVLVDRFMGKRTAPVPRDGASERSTGRLMGRGRHSNIEQTGTITFRVECSSDIRSS